MVPMQTLHMIITDSNSMAQAKVLLLGQHICRANDELPAKPSWFVEKPQLTW